MISKIFLLVISLSFLTNLKAQKYSLGDELTPVSSEFKLIGISSKTGVHSYKYIKPLYERMFERAIGEITIGVKEGHIVSTLYNLIPETDDIGVPSSIIETIQRGVPFPLTLVDGTYGINIDKESISISRAKNAMTYGKDRIMFYSTIKYSLLLNGK